MQPVRPRGHPDPSVRDSLVHHICLLFIEPPLKSAAPSQYATHAAKCVRRRILQVKALAKFDLRQGKRRADVIFCGDGNAQRMGNEQRRDCRQDAGHALEDERKEYCGGTGARSNRVTAGPALYPASDQDGYNASYITKWQVPLTAHPGSPGSPRSYHRSHTACRPCALRQSGSRGR